MRIGIFSPVYHRNKEVQKFLISLLSTNFSEFEVYLCLGINGADENLKYFISAFGEAASGHFTRVIVFDPENNIGKPAIVNEMVKSLEGQVGEIDYVISIDSDMVITNPEWANILVGSFTNPAYSGDKPLGALCANQSGENCHILNIDPIAYDLGSCHIITRVGNEGVAGGVLVTPLKVWKELGGYCAHRLYASDDGHYALACSEHGYVMGMVPEVSFYHPLPTNPDYSGWKHRAANDVLSEEEKKGFRF